MEGGKQTGSSLANDLFGAKDSHKSGSASGVFSSIFDPPSKVMGRESLHLPKTDKKAKNEFGNHPDDNATGSEGQSYAPSKDYGSYYQEQKAPPFHYSSSIYYGGQDVYSRPQDTQSTVFTTFKDGGEDDAGGASRGNWWQGSLYY